MTFQLFVNVPDALALTNADLDRVLAEAKSEIGAVGVRILVPWATVAPTASTYNWADVDRVLGRSWNANLPVMLVLTGPRPSWITASGPTTPAAAVAPIHYSDLVRTAVTRYKPGGIGGVNGVTHYQLWNEPNAYDSWGVAASSAPGTLAAQYVAHLRLAYPSAKAAFAGAVVIFGGLRGGGAVSGSLAEAGSYARTVLASAARLYDAMAYHPLTLPTASNANPPAPSGRQISQADAVRQAMVSTGGTAKKVYWTQVGFDVDRWSDLQQADYLETMRWFAARRKDHVTLMGLSTYRDVAPRTSGMVTPTWSPRPARAKVGRWKDTQKRHTLYTACGTTQDGWGYAPPANALNAEMLLTMYHNLGGVGRPPPGTRLPDFARSPDTVVGTNVDQNLFNWVPISYPASWAILPNSLDNDWQPSTLSMIDSITYGVNEMIGLIQATPGTFALAGNSQGAGVISQVLRHLITPGGRLYSRQNDCIAAVAFGNPCRKQGSGFPGAAITTGAGICVNLTGNVSGLKNVNTPSWWWELVTPGDFFADAPMNGPGGPLLGQVLGALIGARGSSESLNLITFIMNAFINNGVGFNVLGALVADSISKIFARKNPTAFSAAMAWINSTATLYNNAESYYNNPHALYGRWSPPVLPTGLGLSPGATYMETATAYLNSRGAAITPR